MKGKPTVLLSFRPGERVRCVKAWGSDLRKGRVYTVAPSAADDGPPSALVAVTELPERLFHPGRFKLVEPS